MVGRRCGRGVGRRKRLPHIGCGWQTTKDDGLPYIGVHAGFREGEAGGEVGARGRIITAETPRRRGKSEADRGRGGSREDRARTAPMVGRRCGRGVGRRNRLPHIGCGWQTTKDDGLPYIGVHAGFREGEAGGEVGARGRIITAETPRRRGKSEADRGRGGSREDRARTAPMVGRRCGRGVGRRNRLPHIGCGWQTTKDDGLPYIGVHAGFREGEAGGEVGARGRIITAETPRRRGKSEADRGRGGSREDRARAAPMVGRRCGRGVGRRNRLPHIGCGWQTTKDDGLPYIGVHAGFREGEAGGEVGARGRIITAETPRRRGKSEADRGRGGSREDRARTAPMVGRRCGRGVGRRNRLPHIGCGWQTTKDDGLASSGCGWQTTDSMVCAA